MSNETQNPTESEQSAKSCCNVEEMAAEAVQRAKLELERAQNLYENLRRQSAEKIEEIRDRKIGELVDCTLSSVKKRPGLSLIASAVIGFYAGRLLQKMLGK